LKTISDKAKRLEFKISSEQMNRFLVNISKLLENLLFLASKIDKNDIDWLYLEAFTAFDS
jgi:hypothetical protein